MASVHGELEVQRDKSVAQAIEHEQRPLEALVVRAMNDPAFDVDKLERLMALMERKEAQERKERYDAALLRVQMAAPRIAQNGLMDRGVGKGQIPYAKREDIDAVMRPIYQREGFTVTWTGPTGDDGKIHVIGKFSAHGHSELHEWICGPDASGGKTGPQAVSSTIAYGKRQISKMVWDIIEEGLDKNGAKREDVECISQAQADEIRTRMNDLSQKAPGILLLKLCEMHGVKRPEEIKVGQLASALASVATTEKQKAAR